MSDPLALWWVHPVAVRRYRGMGQGGAVNLDAAVTVTGFYEDRDQLVTGPDGEQVTARGVFAAPPGTPLIPLGSELTLPAAFGGRVVRVVSTSVADSGGLPLPAHSEYGVV